MTGAQSKYLVPVVLAASAVVVVLVAMLWLNRLQQRGENQVAAPEKAATVQEAIPEKPSYSPKTYLRPKLVDGKVELWLEAADPNLTLTAFTLQVTINSSGSLTTKATEPTYNPELTNANWTFPISKVEMNDDALVVKIAGAHVAQKPYPLGTKPILLASIPVSNSGQLTAMIDPVNSKVLDHQAKEFHFFDVDTPISIE